MRGLTVTEVSRGVEGAYCARLLADAGAQVIKIETPDGDDFTRRAGPFPNGEPDANASGLFHYLNAGKQAVSLNLDAGAGREIFKKLLLTTDILITDSFPSELDGIGLGHARRLELNNKLIDCVITPFGLTGPYHDMRGDDIVILSLGGMTGATPRFPDYVVSREKERPLRAEGYAAAIISGAAAAASILTALFARMMDGKGRQIDLSQMEAVASTMIRDVASYSYAGIVSGRRTEEEQSGTAYAPNIYLPCKDGMVVLVTASEEAWKRFVEIMGSPAWAKSPEFKDTAARATNINSLVPKLIEWTSTQTGAEITEITQSNGLPCAHVLRIPELVDSQHVKERNALIDIAVGNRPARMPGPPFRIDGVFGNAPGPVPNKGEHNLPILRDLLKYTDAEIAELRAVGAI